VRASPRWIAWGESWSRFWFGHPSLATLSLVRVATGVMLFYALFTYTFDLNGHLGGGGWGDAEILKKYDTLAWPYSIYSWVHSVYWVWAVHVLAMLIAASFIMGVKPVLTGGLSVVFYGSALHQNPGVVVEMDQVVLMLLIYLTLAPTGSHFAVPSLRQSGPGGYRWDPPGNDSQWGSFVLRLMQIHLCLFYFFSALNRLTDEWLLGAPLLHPRLAERGYPLGEGFLQAHPAAVVILAFSLVVFQLFYGVFIWGDRVRYPLVGLAVVLHLVVGLVWGDLSFNLMMAAWNWVFLPADWVEDGKDWAKSMLGLPWFPPQG